MRGFLALTPSTRQRQTNIDSVSTRYSLAFLFFPIAALCGAIDFGSGIINVSSTELAATPVGPNWTSYNGDYTGRRYSSLSQINTANVGNLKAEWVFHARNSNLLEGTPVVVNGMMFVTSANDAFALDAKTGRTVWHYSRPVTEGLVDDASSHHNRGRGRLALASLHADR